MNPFLQRMVGRIVHSGNLVITGPDGTTHSFGDGQGERVHIDIRTKHAERAIALDPMLAFPEAFMDEEVEFVIQLETKRPNDPT